MKEKFSDPEIFPASFSIYLFSINSFNAFEGLCMISPAAILFTTLSSNFMIF